jgi:hypothetical protein
MRLKSAAAAVVTLMLAASTAQAGCLTGAVVGGVAGHFAHHHALAGAAAGCVVGHELAVHKKRRLAAERAARLQTQRSGQPIPQGAH